MAYICTVCGHSEQECQCPKYCMLCKTELDVRLCEDGCYYCTDCREVCGYTSEQRFRS